MIELSVGYIAHVVFITFVIKLVPSRTIEMSRTTSNGAQAVIGPKGLIAGMD